ncbi:MAG TPA: tetratricopeptide repeat protein [Flavipsychrobacter sp.]|nr:tetratricopeptide repeat protein [Flavipsychrobacter sp.]
MANTVRNKPGTERITTIEETNPLETIQDKYEQNKKRINTAIFVVLAAVIGFFAYQKFIKEPKETKASNAISYAQMYFAQDSVNKALNGDGQHQGFLQIIKKYGGTKAGNLAQYYAGISFLQMNDPKNAIKHLKEFDAQGTNVQYVAYGALGDAYMENNNVKEGIEYYNKAAANKDDNLITPIYLYRAAMAYEMNNQADKAKENYKRIRDEYPLSMQAREIDKHLARLGVLD